MRAPSTPAMSAQKDMAELLHTALKGLPPPRVGKVREVYDLGAEMLIVATDRISAFDVVMGNGIPDKGKVLNQMSAFWFETLKDICPNHVISFEDSVIQSRLNSPHPEISGRSMVAKKAVCAPRLVKLSETTLAWLKYRNVDVTA